jgi:hypothetical protein
MSRRGKVALAALLLMGIVIAAWFLFLSREMRSPEDQNQALNRMIELQKWGFYDRAAKVVRTWMNDSRRDASHDDFLYFEIAMVYIAKAYKMPAARDESIHQAELNLEGALRVYDQAAPKDIDVMLFEIGGGYELLGDASPREKCRLYEKAREVLLRQLPLIKGDAYAAYGHTTRLEPVRADIRKHLNAVNEKYLKAGCQAH